MIFNKKNHSYSEGEIRYTPVNDFIKEFVPDFPAEFVAEKVAKRDGLSVGQVLEMWDMNRNISTLYGESIHKSIELYQKYRVLTKLPHVRLAVEKFFEIYKVDSVVSEQIAKNDEFLVAGTIDIIEKLGNQRVNIIDIKTNYEMDKAASGKLLPPLQNLPNDKLTKYRLQLSTYKWLLECIGLSVENLILQHWDGTKYNRIDLQPIDIIELLKYKQETKGRAI